MFSFESQMTGMVKAWLERERLNAWPEFRMPHGICDIVGCSLNATALRRSKAGSAKPLGSLRRIYLFSLLPEITAESSGASPKDIFEKTCGTIEISRITSEMNRLVSEGRAIRDAERRYFRLGKLEKTHKRIVAVELKLTEVRAAFRQASRNLEYASESYVAYPIKKAVDVAGNYKSNDAVVQGIGILGVARNGCQVIAKPARATVNRNRLAQYYIAEKFYEKFSRSE